MCNLSNSNIFKSTYWAYSCGVNDSFVVCLDFHILSFKTIIGCTFLKLLWRQQWLKTTLPVSFSISRYFYLISLWREYFQLNTSIFGYILPLISWWIWFQKLRCITRKENQSFLYLLKKTITVNNSWCLWSFPQSSRSLAKIVTHQDSSLWLLSRRKPLLPGCLCSAF